MSSPASRGGRVALGLGQQQATLQRGEQGQRQPLRVGVGTQDVAVDQVAQAVADRAGPLGETVGQGFEAGLAASGIEHTLLRPNAYLQAFSLIAAGDAAWLSPDVATLLGRPARSFDQFAADHATAFS